MTDELKFEKTVIQVPYKHKGETEIQSYKVHFRPALDTVKHVLEDPALREHLIRYPERHYVRKPGTNENMRVWTDVHTADDWWELQVIPHSHHITRAKHGARTKWTLNALPSTFRYTVMGHS